MAAAAAMAARNVRKKREEAANLEKTQKANGTWVEPEEEEVVHVPLRKAQDVSQWTGCPQSYVKFANVCQKTTESNWFNTSIIMVIIVAGILVGIQTYEDMEQNPSVGLLDNIILGIFVIECLLKMFAEGMAPWRYWTGPEWKWNNFDFIIVLLCLPGIKDIFGDGSVGLLRLFRLMRIMKLVKKIPQLQMIIMGLVGGLGSIAYIMALLMLVLYLYAIMGIYAFRTNDPINFGTLHDALLVLFRMSTLEDWTDVMYINMYGCNATHFYDDGFLWGSYNSGVYGQTRAESGIWTNMYCKTSNPNTVISVVYHVSFVLISALVMLSLFIGAVTMSMTESMEEMKEQAEASAKKKQMAKAKKEQDKQDEEERLRAEAQARGDAPRIQRKKSESAHAGKQKGKMRAVLMSAWENTDLLDLLDGVDEFSGHAACKWYWHVSKFMKKITDADWFSNFVTIVIIAAGITVGMGTYYDDMSITDQRKVNIATLGPAWENYSLTAPDGGPFCDRWFLSKNASGVSEDEMGLNCLPVLPESMLVIDTIILAIFTSEVLMKTIACFDKPWEYFYKGDTTGAQAWNIFDFIVVAGSFLPAGGGLVTILRLLRLLRVLKLLKALPELQVIVGALISGLGSIGYIAVVLILVFYVCAIVGMMLFRDNDPWHFGSLHVSMLSLFRCSTLEDWTDVMYINIYGSCNYAHNYDSNFNGYAGSSTPWAVHLFDNSVLHDSRSNLSHAGPIGRGGGAGGPPLNQTIHPLTSVLTMNMTNLTRACDFYSYYDQEKKHQVYVNRILEKEAGCGLEGNPACKWPVIREQGQGALAVLFFVFFTIIAALVLMTLFIGVVTTSMEEASDAQEQSKKVEQAVKDYAQENNMDPQTVKMYTMCFEIIDVDGSESIDEDELLIALKSIGKTPTRRELMAMMESVDADMSGQIDLCEFIIFMELMKSDKGSMRSLADGKGAPAKREMLKTGIDYVDGKGNTFNYDDATGAIEMVVKPSLQSLAMTPGETPGEDPGGDDERKAAPESLELGALEPVKKSPETEFDAARPVVEEKGDPAPSPMVMTHPGATSSSGTLGGDLPPIGGGSGNWQDTSTASTMSASQVMPVTDAPEVMSHP